MPDASSDSIDLPGSRATVGASASASAADPATAAAPTSSRAGPMPVSPIDPMLAKVADGLPDGEGWQFEPKWDGFRAIVFRTGGMTTIQSRDGRPLNRYFPELEEALGRSLPKGAVVDGEIVVARGARLDFDALQQRVHPAASRVRKLALETPASFVAFDLLAAGGRSTLALPQHERRTRLERLLGSAPPPLHLTPMTRDRALAADWLQRFEGAGLDGVIARPVDAPYRPGKRALLKIKHVRSADCVVAGFRWFRAGGKDGSGAGTRPQAPESAEPSAGREPLVGSLLLGLHDEAGVLQQVGVTSSFTLAMRRELVELLAPLRLASTADHPWHGWAGPADDDAHRMPGGQSRWSAGKDLAWEPLRPERVAEVRYDHLQGTRFRHATTFLRWRDDKPAATCRYDQLEVVAPFELKAVFRG